MQLLTTEDPRDNLEKASRWELEAFAKENGCPVPHGYPAMLTIKVLRARGLTQIKIKERPLGLYNGGETITASPNVPSQQGISPEDLLEAQFKEQQNDLSNKSMNELRALCKELGIKMDRRDNMKTLRDKLGQQNAP